MTDRVELLGGIAVTGNGTASGGSLPGRRAELVFAYLAAEHHRVVTQDELANALGPDTLPDSWAAGLRGVVTEVRRYLEEAGLGEAEVRTTRRGYQLQFSADVVVDLDEARDELARARARLDAGDGSEAAAHGALKGFGLALDHLGTRRPSPDRLARIPFTQVKVDASLVSGAAIGRERLALLEETFDATQSLGIPAVAEGCESEADFDLVAEMGFRYPQGSFVGGAMEAEELVDWAATWGPP